MRCLLMNVDQLAELLLRGRDQLTGRRMVALGLLPGGVGILAVDLRRDAAELLLGRGQLAHRDGEQAVGVEGQPFVQPQLLLEPVASEPEVALAARGEVLLEILGVGADRGGRFHRRVGEVAKDVHVIEPRKGARQVLVDEALRTAHALEADLDEDAGRFLDVVAGGLHQPRHLPQLGDDPTGALRQRRIVEQRLTGEAGRDDVGVELGIAFPGPDPLEFEEPGADAVLERRPLDPLDVGQPPGVDGGEPAREAPRGRGPARRPPAARNPPADRHAGGHRRKLRSWDELRAGTRGTRQRSEEGVRLNTCATIWPSDMSGILYVVATPIGNLEDVTLRALRVLREVSVIAAEDTRRTARLLQHYSISTPTTSLHEHNEHAKTSRLIERLQGGDSIALVSDAGTPVISDPGSRLVREAHHAGITVQPVPGAERADRDGVGGRVWVRTASRSSALRQIGQTHERHGCEATRLTTFRWLSMRRRTGSSLSLPTSRRKWVTETWRSGAS